ncbi:unnamed protein product [Miscanthus lutarioriparius]|uniref:Uncharacterized protein n=1 Tax=Miscanthus lutarioriparius TaxID=422564 RepID=A0A811R263_9POAL|nr:unnamed protein product [Miscanthus lutarioriparius]
MAAAVAMSTAVATGAVGTKSGKDDYDGGYNESGTNDDEYGRRGTGGGYNCKSSGDDAYTGGGGGYNSKSGGEDDGEYGSSPDDSEKYRKEEKYNKWVLCPQKSF